MGYLIKLGKQMGTAHEGIMFLPSDGLVLRYWKLFELNFIFMSL